MDDPCEDSESRPAGRRRRRLLVISVFIEYKMRNSMRQNRERRVGGRISRGKNELDRKGKGIEN